MSALQSLARMTLVAMLGALCALALPPVLTRTAEPTHANPVTANACDPDRAIHVTGAATVNVVPDRALIRLGVQSTDRVPDQAQAINQATVMRVVAALRQLGIAERDISTDIYIVTPIYQSDGLAIAGYRVENSVAVTLRDVQQVGRAVIEAFKAGANNVSELELYSSELRRYRDQARDLAMKAAAEKAQALANAAGTRTGCVLSISENSWSYYNNWWNRNQAAPWAQNIVQNAPANTGPMPGETPISVGQIAVRAEISASFSLE